MKFLKNNMFTLFAMVFMLTFVMSGDAFAQTVDVVVKSKLVSTFQAIRTIVFVIGGFGLIALAFQAIFGKVKWTWFAGLAFGLAVLAVAGKIVDYATGDTQGSAFADTLQ